MSKWIVFLSLALAGCVTQAERTAQWQAEVDNMIQTYGPACERLGYKRDDDKWRDCVLRLSARDNLRYHTYARSTSCFGHRGFYTCSSF